MNAARILDELRLERKVVAQRLAGLDDAIAVFARLDGARTAVADPPAPKGDGRRRATVDWARARQQYENAGTPVSRIAAAFKVSQSVVYARIKAEGWKRRPAEGAE